LRERGSYMRSGWYEQVDPDQRHDYRNGFYERDYVTWLGTIRQRIARTRAKNFLPPGLEKFEGRAEDVAILIREAFLRGISARQVGRVVATFTGEPVSAQTVSKLTRELMDDLGWYQFEWLVQALLKDQLGIGVESWGVQFLCVDESE
jgi:putative transposase